MSDPEMNELPEIPEVVFPDFQNTWMVSEIIDILKSHSDIDDGSTFSKTVESKRDFSYRIAYTLKPTDLILDSRNFFIQELKNSNPHLRFFNSHDPMATPTRILKDLLKCNKMDHALEIADQFKMGLVRGWGITEDQACSILFATYLKTKAHSHSVSLDFLVSMLTLFSSLNMLGFHATDKFSLSLCLVMCSSLFQDLPKRGRMPKTKAIVESTEMVDSCFESADEIYEWLTCFEGQYPYSLLNKAKPKISRSWVPIPIEFVVFQNHREHFSKNLRILSMNSKMSLNMELFLAFMFTISHHYSEAPSGDLSWTDEQVENVGGIMKALNWAYNLWSGDAATKWEKADISCAEANQHFNKYGVTNPEDLETVNGANSSWLTAWSDDA